MQAAGAPPQYEGSWVEVLNREGFSVCGIDQQGCGFSEGLECYVERFQHYVNDVLQFARFVPAFSSPQYLSGPADCIMTDCLVISYIHCSFFLPLALINIGTIEATTRAVSVDGSTLSLCRSLPSCGLPGFRNVPTFIAGCSLGGCIAVNAIHREVC